MIREVLRHGRHGFRLMGRQTGPAAVAVVTLALGIASVVVLAAVQKALLHPSSPFPEPERLVLLWGSLPTAGYERLPLSDADLVDYRSSGALASLAAFGVEKATFLGADTPREISLARVEPGFFSVLGVGFFLGECGMGGEGAPTVMVGGEMPGAGSTELGDKLPSAEGCGSPEAESVILAHRFWRQAFGANPDVLGRWVEIAGLRLRVTGILAEEVAFPPPISWQGRTVGDGQGADAFVALSVDPSSPRSNRHLLALGRVRPGSSLGGTNRWLSETATRLAEQYPSSNPHELSAFALPLHRQASEMLEGPLTALGSASLLLLLVACANVAQLSLAKSVARSEELSLRSALGADPHHLATQLTLEGLALAMVGGLCGSALAWAGIEGISRLKLPGVPYLETVAVDGGILAVALLVSFASALLFALLPALYIARQDLSPCLKGAGRTTAGMGVRRLQSGLVIAELTIAVALLTAAAFLLHDFWDLSRQDPGFRHHRVLKAEIRFGGEGFSEGDLGTLLDRVGSAPGVRSVALASSLPLTPGLDGSRFTVEGREDEVGETLDLAVVRHVTADYFRSLAIPLVEGSALALEEGEPTVVVSRLLSRRYWPAGSPVGRRLTLEDPRSPEARWMRIVGVADTVAEGDLRSSDGTVIYLPLLGGSSRWADSDPPRPKEWGDDRAEHLDGQAGRDRGDGYPIDPPRSGNRRGVGDDAGQPTEPGFRKPDTLTLLVSHQPMGESAPPRIASASGDRAREGKGGGLADEIRRSVWQQHPDVAITVRPLSESLDMALMQPRTASSLLAILALLATLLGGLGIYGVMSFRVVRQRHEIAVRAAMGANRRELAAWVMGDALRLASKGAIYGALLSLFVGRFLQRWIYDVGPGNLPILLLAALSALPLALLAAWIPSRRAMAVDPASILRGD